MEKSFLREFKGFKIMDAGPVEGGEPGDRKIEVVDLSGEVLHTEFMSDNQPKSLNKGIEKAKAWITDAQRTEKPLDEKKEPVKERKCRVCGCTQDNCQQCIDKTGIACHWVEDDLCSACVEEPKIEVTDNRAAAGAGDPEPAPAGEETNFFSQLASAGIVDMSIRLMEKDGRITVSIVPGLTSRLHPIILTGTAEELDREFFTSIAPQVKAITGIVSNIDDVKKQTEESAAENATKSEKKKQASKPKSRPAKKPIVKPKPKPVAKAKVKSAPAKKAKVEKPQKPKSEKKKIDAPAAEEKPATIEQALF